ncbi:MAG: 50S ribosomal protein L15 [Patescibacteria group bacterium]
MQLHTIHPARGSRKNAKRIGRGLGSGHGTYSTRGMKGQRARSGGSKGLKLKGMKQMLLRIPKVRGFKSIHPSFAVVRLSDVNTRFDGSDIITPAHLAASGLVTLQKGGKALVKILGGDPVTKSLRISGIAVSASARTQIEKAGGEIIADKT